jgi:hypothetical protein
MAEHIRKLSPDRDLQCYFERPSAVAALSGSSPQGFTVSGCWRQQFDWAVVEWNRDNVFEHPELRNLPDGDLSGIQLSYTEVRSNCIPFDSKLYPTVDWPYLRLWVETGGTEHIYRVRLKDHATPIEGSFVSATAEFELQGVPHQGDYIELAWLAEHYNYQVAAGDTLASALSALAGIISLISATVTATTVGNRIHLAYDGTQGSNANRIGVYATVHGSATQTWAPQSAVFAGGQSPTKWRIDLDFGSLHDVQGALVPTTQVRKLRWTWAADLQPGDFERREFAVAIADWTVTGVNTVYRVAGPGSRRIEDDNSEVVYGGEWHESRGNFSGGSIRFTTAAGAWVRWTGRLGGQRELYLGTRRAPSAASIAVTIDGGAPTVHTLQLAGEDVLVRVPLGTLAGGPEHTVKVTHTGSNGSYCYFDFLELAAPCTDLPEFPTIADTTLATDWDTDHSIALAPERTAWLMKKLGFVGRANHYVGALWFYELIRLGHQFASVTVTFSGSPEWSGLTEILLGPTSIQHVNLIGDTAESVAKCFAFLINAGSTGVWARSEGAVLTIVSRTMGAAGNGLSVTVNTNSSTFAAQISGAALAGGSDGDWRTDLNSLPRINRAARDWSRSFFQTLAGYGIDVAAAFSMELQHGDPSVEAGVAQRYPNGDPALLNTPALQTNFSLVSTSFWKQVYCDMAAVMSSAGVQPYLQFGEVQWWYFAAPSGMPFYDEYTKTLFQAQYGRPMRVIPAQTSTPSAYPEEVAFLPGLIGAFTDAVMQFVRATHPSTRFEVLYPPDVNDTPLNRLVNYPSDQWTPSRLNCLKTENFTYTGNRDLDKAREAIGLPLELGFPRSQSSHLVGIGEYTTPWAREHRLAQGEYLESVVLFALDQFCLIGYGLPLERGTRRSFFLGT